MSRPNKCIKDENGQEQWISRSTVVIPITFKYDAVTGDIFTLVEQRGESVTHTGEWCCPCGYIDWDESLEEACQREVQEETGLTLNTDLIRFFKVETDKYSKTQTVDLWYQCWADTNSDFDKDKIETKDEIFDVRWLKVANISSSGYGTPTTVTIFKKDIYAGYGKWAFKKHHKAIIEMILDRFNNFEMVIDE